MDLFAPDASTGSALNILLNDGKGRFRDWTKRSGSWHTEARTHGMACADFDDDGDLDAFLTSRDANVLFANDGHALFAEVSSQAQLNQPLGDTKAATFFDYDGDGDLDLYIVVHDGKNRLFRNDQTGGNWLAVRLFGRNSNSDGVGSKIEVTTRSRSQTREVIGGRGHMQDPFVQFFGLGDDSIVDYIRITWPTGKVQIMRNVEANQVIAVEESS